MKGLLLTRYEREMLEQEREMARSNDDLDLFVKTSCIQRVSEGHLQKEVAEMFGVPLRSLAKADPEKQKEWTERELLTSEKPPGPNLQLKPTSAP